MKVQVQSHPPLGRRAIVFGSRNRRWLLAGKELGEHARRGDAEVVQVTVVVDDVIRTRALALRIHLGVHEPPGLSR